MAIPREELLASSAKRGADFRVYHDAANNKYSLESMMVILLSDIRDELHQLNTLLGCKRFTEIPTRLQEISTQTRKRTYPKKGTR